jgi:hypothetical protein
MAGLQRFDNSNLFCTFRVGRTVFSLKIRHDLIPSTLAATWIAHKDINKTNLFMTTYKIKQSSPWLYIATILTVIFVGMAIVIFLAVNHVFPKGHPIFFILGFAPIFVLAFYLPRYTATADIQITLDDDGLKRSWLNQFFLHENLSDEFKWNEIVDYVFQPDRQFDQFKLHLKDGTKFKFFHNNDHDSKDDFQKFLSDFSKKVELYNNADNDKKNDIKLGKTIYETGWGLILAGFAIIVIVGLPILLILTPTKKNANYAMLAFSYIGAIYFLLQVYIHRKRRKEYEEGFR